MTAPMRAAARIHVASCARVSRGVACASLMNELSCDAAVVPFPDEKSRSACSSFDAREDLRLVATFVAAVTRPCSAMIWSWTPRTVTLNELGCAVFPIGSLAVHVTVVVLVFAFGARPKNDPDGGEQDVAICAAELSGSVAVTA